MVASLYAKYGQKRYILQFTIVFGAICGLWLLWHQGSPNAWGLSCQGRIARAGIPQAEWYITYSPGKPQVLLDSGAKVITAQDLINGKYGYNETRSRIIHQTWKTHDATEYPLHEFWHSKEHWVAHHPGWFYVLWDNADNRELVEKKYPELLSVYDGFKHEIARADFVRNLYLHQFGGIYADMDVLPLRNLLQHLEAFTSDSEKPVAYVAEMLHGGKEGIPNAWMASSRPEHPFWKSVYERTVKRVQDGATQDHIEHLTGPLPLYLSVQDWKKWGKEKPEVVLLRSPTIFPYSWAEPNKAIHCICSAKYPETFDPRRCISLYRDSWTITFWGSSWFKGIKKITW